MLAYAQSEWMLDYIIRRYGFGKVNDILAGYADGKDQADVLHSALGVNEEQFDSAFRTWARQQIIEWGFSPDPVPDLADAARRAKEQSGLADAHADHALALMVKGKLDDAEKAAREALKIEPDNSRALGVLATVYLRKKEHDKAIETARRLEASDPTTAVAPRVLAKSYLYRRDWPQAIGALELLQQRQPYDSFSYEQLAKIYMQLGQSDKALPNLLHLHQHSMNNPTHARQIAEIYRSQGRHDLAIRFFRDVTYINPYETSAYQGLAGIYARQRQYDKARTAATNMTLIEPDSARGWNYLAMVGYRAGKASGSIEELKAARDAAEKARQLDSRSQAAQIIDAIDAAIDDLRNGG
jgi:predicted Zn-dependent protease